MKNLYIIRHAKSSWKDMNLSDYARPLNKRGKGNALLMGSVLKNKGIVPDIIITSPALRAKTTAKIIAKEINYSQKIIFKEEIYEANTNTLHKIVKHLDDEINTVFLFGHNPGLNELSYKYVHFCKNIPTCGVLEIEFDSKSWMSIDTKNAKLISFDYPKQYKTKSERF